MATCACKHRAVFIVYDLAFLSLQVGTAHPGNSELVTFHGTHSLHLTFLWDISRSSCLCWGGFCLPMGIDKVVRKTWLPLLGMGLTAERGWWDWVFLFGFVIHLSILHILAEPPS